MSVANEAHVGGIGVERQQAAAVQKPRFCAAAGVLPLWLRDPDSCALGAARADGQPDPVFASVQDRAGVL